jgi:hypothetical protein
MVLEERHSRVGLGEIQGKSGVFELGAGGVYGDKEICAVVGKGDDGAALDDLAAG